MGAAPLSPNALRIPRVGTTRRKLVDIPLSDTYGNHDKSTEEESNAHTLDGSEVGADLLIQERRRGPWWVS